MPLFPLLEQALEKNASDLHLSCGVRAMVRIQGKLTPLTQDSQPLTPQEMDDFCQSILPEKTALGTPELDLAYHHETLGRFRVNIFQQQRGLSMAIRLIPKEIIPLTQFQLPVLQHLLERPHGLILVTGATGMGKSTTLSSMLDALNEHHALHILTIEDPIEFLHEARRSLIQQREVKRHTKSFHEALKNALREDPDVMMIGELRDLETIRLALTAAETGHLVLATLHTTSSISSINRLIDVFQGDEKQLIRYQLAESLQGVVSQVLIETSDHTKRVAAFEILINTAAVKNLIRENKTNQIDSILQTNQALGMQTLSQHLQQLADLGIIRQQTMRDTLR